MPGTTTSPESAAAFSGLTRDWKFRPFVAAGKPTAVCSIVGFEYPPTATPPRSGASPSVVLGGSSQCTSELLTGARRAERKQCGREPVDRVLRSRARSAERARPERSALSVAPAGQPLPPARGGRVHSVRCSLRHPSAKTGQHGLGRRPGFRSPRGHEPDESRPVALIGGGAAAAGDHARCRCGVVGGFSRHGHDQARRNPELCATRAVCRRSTCSRTVQSSGLPRKN
jgi:hypothetical protein